MSSQNNNDAPSNSVPDRSAQPLKPSEVLERAAALIESPSGWTQRFYARSAPDSPIDLWGDDPEATCWCALGSIHAAAGTHDIDKAQPFEAYLERAIGAVVAQWNDAPERTQAEVVAALRQAAELARSEGQ